MNVYVKSIEINDHIPEIPEMYAMVVFEDEESDAGITVSLSLPKNDDLTFGQLKASIVEAARNYIREASVP